MIFAQKSIYLKENVLENPSMNYGLSKSAKVILSMSIFFVKISKEYQFRRPFFVKKHVFF